MANAAMAESIQQQSRVSVFLKQHEQWSAWAFFTLMSGLIMYCQGQRGVALLHTPLLGIMLLYVLKICALYVRRSTAWALTGLCFAATPFYHCPQAELCMSLQVVVLCHVLVWARGKRDAFQPRHFVVWGVSMGLSLLIVPAAALFYVPVAVLMLWSNRHRWWKDCGAASVGLLLPLGVALVCRPILTETVTLPSGGLAPGVVMAVVPVLLCGAFVTVRRSRPTRRYAVAGLLALGWGAGLVLYPGWTYFYPLLILAVVGGALLLHRYVANRRMLYLLRAVGLLVPFITLCAVLILPIWRQATGG